jgi:uncharacterized repeat protein (TIGR02543 family)
MRKLRITLFFIFAALSLAWADCASFTISANGTSLGSGSSVNYSIMIGEDLEFTVAPEGESIVWWLVVGAQNFAVGDKSSFSPPTSIEALGGNTLKNIIYKVTNCGIEKTINLTLNVRTYRVNFNSDGGTSVSQQTIEHGQKATSPTPPTKTGYTFAYWYLNNENTAFNFATPITDNITLKAKWDINKYTVTFNSGGGSAVGSQTVNHGSTVAKPANPTRAGYTFVRWELPVGTEYNFSNPVTGNITLTAKWDINKYTVTFNSGGGSAVSPQTVNHGSTAAKPANPTRTGYTFVRWELPVGTEYNFSNPVTGNITLTAKWDINKYTVTFNSNGGSAVSPQTVNHGSTATKPANPTRTGYTFVRWELPVGTEYNFSNSVTGNITLTAKWDINKYTVTFNSNGGNTVNPVMVDYNTTVAKPSNPTRTGYTFERWELPVGTEYSFSNPVTGNITLTAKWTPKSYTISFNISCPATTVGTCPVNPTSKTVTYDAKIGTLSAPTLIDYNFLGWFYNNNSQYTEETTYTIDSNITLTAKWDIKKFTVAFNSNGGSAVPSQTVNYGSAATKPANPTRIGYTFAPWELSGSEYNFSTPVTNNITLTAKWDIINYTITYNYKDGTPIPPLTSSYNIESGTISLPSMQERCGWVFDGWLDNPNLSGVPSLSFTPNANNVGNKNFYEKWTQGLMTPNVNLLNYNIPNLTYSGQAIAPTTITVSPKAENKCALGAITLLYNGTGALPKDAGTYAISASIAENDSYKAAIIPLGSLTIGKANITIDIESATAKNKVYDATTTAEITSISFSFVSALLGSDKVSASDYSVTANFDSPNVGTSIPVTGTLTWLANGPLSKNYNISLSTLSFSSSAADITQAAGTLKIEQPDYELSNQKSYTISKSPFVQPSDIHIEYRKDEGAYSTHLPNRIGTYTIKAWFDPTENYTGAIDSATFTVTRGNATTVIHDKILETGFTYDPALSAKLRYYYVAGTELCNIKSTKVQITVIEPDIIFRMLSLDSIRLDSIDRGEQGDDGFMYYEITLNFGKPGVDTLFYALLSRDGIYREYDTLLIETPIPFDSIAGQKWNNTLFINNNPKINGGYEFSDFKWFENGIQISEMQSYSAGPSSADTLNPKDIYKVTMHTTDGMRISTCEGHPPKPKVLSTATKSAFTKQVLGINGKTTKSNAKIYNLKGSKTENTPAGVYIIEDR